MRFLAYKAKLRKADFCLRNCASSKSQVLSNKNKRAAEILFSNAKIKVGKRVENVKSRLLVC